MADDIGELVIPGLFDSGPDHWQSLWAGRRDGCRRVELGQWHAPTPGLWIARLDRAIAREPRPVILVAHSLGCLAVAWWAAEASLPRLAKVQAAMLVAPPDVDAPDADPRIRAFAPTPALRLPFPALLVASRDDRYARFQRSAWMAESWGAQLIDADHAGHINAESRLGDWPRGQALLDGLHRQARRFAAPPSRAIRPDAPLARKPADETRR